MKGYNQVIEFLCYNGFPIDEVDSVKIPLFKDQVGKTALHYAAISNEVEATKTLLKFGANINAQTRVFFPIYEQGGDTPLMKAVEVGSQAVVKELILWNCDFRVQNNVLFMYC